MEFLASADSFLLGVIFSPFFYWVFFVAIILFEYNDWRKFTSFLVVVFTVLTYHLYDFNSQEVTAFVASYFPVGFVYSIFRWKRYCSRTVDEYKKKRVITKEDLERAEQKLSTSNKIEKIVCWILSWPFSLVVNILGDFFDFVVFLTKKACREIYDKISGKALEKIKDLQEYKDAELELEKQEREKNLLKP